jgi:hypothetical protein
VNERRRIRCTPAAAFCPTCGVNLARVTSFETLKTTARFVVCERRLRNFAEASLPLSNLDLDNATFDFL